MKFLIFSLLFSSVALADIQLNNTLLCDGNPATKTSEQLAEGAEMFKTLYSNGVERISSCLGWTNFNNGKNWYVVAGNMNIYGVNTQSKQYLGSWSVDSFSDPDLEPEIIALYRKYSVDQKIRAIRDLSPKVGCFAQQPLRYGDIDADGKPKLIIFTHDQYDALNMIIFSTDTKKALLNTRLATYDVTPNNRLTLEAGEEASAGNPLANAPTDAQYLSPIAIDNSEKVMNYQPAIISFSKLFIGHYSNETSSDIVVWRKLYKSRENQDPIKGFSKKSDLLIHYQFINGEYKKQPTDSSTIKGWLTAKQLTWKKGYPSKSECPGQEGQYIPEMHDPLLNDADVLQ